MQKSEMCVNHAINRFIYLFFLSQDCVYNFSNQTFRQNSWRSLMSQVNTYPFQFATSTFLSFTCKNDPHNSLTDRKFMTTFKLWTRKTLQRIFPRISQSWFNNPPRYCFQVNPDNKKNMPQSLFGKIDFDFNQSNFIMVFLISFFLSILIYHISISFFSCFSSSAFKKYLEVVRIQARNYFFTFAFLALFFYPP